MALIQKGIYNKNLCFSFKLLDYSVNSFTNKQNINYTLVENKAFIRTVMHKIYFIMSHGI